MSRVAFRKPVLGVADQISMLEQRGMIIHDLAKAERCLRQIGFQRLSDYWRMFQYLDGSEKDDHFRPGTTFDAVLERYVFDGRLRLLCMGAIETIEVAARASISSAMSESYGSHWFQTSANFSNEFDHKDFMREVKQSAGIAPLSLHKQTDAIRRYMRRYHQPPVPPSWVTIETFSLGCLSRAFAGLRNPNKSTIAQRFEMPRKRLQSWLHSLSFLRNLCAHHCRILNFDFGITPLVPESERRHVINPKRFYSFAVAIQTLLTTINGDNRWRDDLKALFAEHPDIPLDLIGFPPDWEQMQIWRDSQKNDPA